MLLVLKTAAYLSSLKKIYAYQSNGSNSIPPRRQTLREIELQMMLNNDCVVKLYGVFEDIKYIYLMIEYVPGHDLFREIRKRGFFTESAARPVATALVAALKHMHDNEIIHRDLKVRFV